MGFLIGIAVLAGVFAAIANAIDGAASKKANALFAQRQAEIAAHERASKLAIDQHQAKATAAIEAARSFLEELGEKFEQGYVQGRKWLIELIGEIEAAEDEKTAKRLETKSRPAPQAADEVRRVKKEKRILLERAKHLEYILKTLYEYYPVLADYEQEILAERATVELEDGEESDPVINYVSKEDYARLTTIERNQLALDRWKNRPKSKVEIGRAYERYIGAQMEQQGWSVSYDGALKGLEDLGRDLICQKGSETRIVQAKNWAQFKTIHENHVLQLFGTTILYERTSGGRARGMLYVTTQLSETAQWAAKRLNIEVVHLSLEADYPQIKCNINQGAKIYHLPFDQQYDRVRIIPAKGECYVKTVAEAERKGFRRAKRWRST